MSEETQGLHAEIARLTLEVRSLHEENKNHRLKRKKAVEELEGLKAQHDTVVKELEAAKTKVETNPDEWRDKYDQLNHKWRETNHKNVFDKVAKELKVREEAIDDLWKLSGYSPEGDDPDHDRIRGVVGEVVAAKPYLLAPEPEVDTKKARLPAGPNVARPSLEPVNKRTVSKAELRDFEFMRRHGKELGIGLKDGSIEIRD
jgi:chromosome segregation ATPase